MCVCVDFKKVSKYVSLYLFFLLFKDEGRKVKLLALCVCSCDGENLVRCCVWYGGVAKCVKKTFFFPFFRFAIFVLLSVLQPAPRGHPMVQNPDKN